MVRAFPSFTFFLLVTGFKGDFMETLRPAVTTDVTNGVEVFFYDVAQSNNNNFFDSVENMLIIILLQAVKNILFDIYL